jgi:vesicle coat complex subunit
LQDHLFIYLFCIYNRYANEVDVDFVRKAVHAIGRCAIKIDEAAERCINVLLDLINTGVSYVVQEAIVVIKVILVGRNQMIVKLLIHLNLKRISSVNTLTNMKGLFPPCVKTLKLWTNLKLRVL